MQMGNSVTEKLNMASQQILRMSRNELYLKMRFLDVALSSFLFVMDEGLLTIGTDGKGIYFNPRWLGGLFREDRILVNRVYLHMVMHGIFRHITRRKGRDKRYYDLACEIAVESVIDGMQHRAVRRSRSLLRRETYRKLNEKLKVLSADKIYTEMKKWNLTEAELRRLEEEFLTDSHDYWPEDDDKKTQQEIENKWQDISEQMETDMETFSKEASADSGHFIDQLKVENRERFDYRQFLRKFSVLREEMAVDPVLLTMCFTVMD